MATVIRNKEIFRDKYDSKCKIGQGGFGSVYKVTEKSTGDVFAAKFIKDKVKGRAEASLLVKLNSDFILKSKEIFEGVRELIIVTELLEGGELFQKIVDHENEDLLEKDCCLYMRQVCQGLEYLQSHNIVHLDIKPENIVLTDLRSKRIKIIDFGTAVEISPNQQQKAMEGTPDFASPEVVNYDNLHINSDQWSLGVLCFVLLSGIAPFGDDDIQVTLENVTRAKYTFDLKEFDKVTASAKDLIIRLLRKSPSERLSASQCLKHEWLSETLMRKKTNKIKIENLKKFLAKRKIQNVGKALRVINVFKEAVTERKESSLDDEDEERDKLTPIVTPPSSSKKVLTRTSTKPLSGHVKGAVNVFNQNMEVKQDSRKVKPKSYQRTSTKPVAGTVNSLKHLFENS